jgi:hypothetical protein
MPNRVLTDKNRKIISDVFISLLILKILLCGVSSLLSSMKPCQEKIICINESWYCSNELLNKDRSSTSFPAKELKQLLVSKFSILLFFDPIVKLCFAYFRIGYPFNKLLAFYLLLFQSITVSKTDVILASFTNHVL